MLIPLLGPSDVVAMFRRWILAQRAKVKKLVLTHVSARYDDTSPLLKQAKKIFKNTVVAEDFFRIELPVPKAESD